MSEGVVSDGVSSARPTAGTGATDHGVHLRGIFTPSLLDQCISCGFCLPACPTYAITKQEPSSPRGRINLMRALEAGTLEEDDPKLADESSFCLGCRACEPVCPAGVQYGQLLEEWRDHQWRGRSRPLVARALTTLIAVPDQLFGVQGLVRRYARTRTPVTADRPHYMLGCVERGLFPSVSRSTLELVPEADAPSVQGCCGALHAHNGDSGRGARMAQALGRRLPGTIVTTAGGCAAHLAHHLGPERVKEVSAYLVEHGHQASGEVRVDGRRARVTLQDSCHLRNGLGVAAEPRSLVKQVADYVEMPSAASCCGAAGTYAMVRPEDSRRVLAPKIEEIEAAGVDFVVAVNPGCLRQLKQGLRRARSPVKAIHLVDLLRMADGEDRPATRRTPRAQVLAGVAGVGRARARLLTRRRAGDFNDLRPTVPGRSGQSVQSGQPGEARR
jgi:glycolate oxidase iron-sulfur subunit